MLYHYTKTEYVESIIQNGIIPGYSQSPYYNKVHIPYIKESCVWLDPKRFRNTKGWSTIKVDNNRLDNSLLERVGRWYKYHGTISPNCITLG